jgi:Flp pilus assembly protein CpaB
LEVTPKQAELLAVASTMGILSLSLRSLTPGEIAEGEIGYTSDREISEAVEASILAQAGIEVPVPVSDKEAPAFAQRKKLKVYRSSALTTLEFSSQK